MKKEYKYSPHKKTLNSDLSEEMNMGYINIKNISKDQEIGPTVSNVTPVSMDKEVHHHKKKIRIGQSLHHSL